MSIELYPNYKFNNITLIQKNFTLGLLEVYTRLSSWNVNIIFYVLFRIPLALPALCLSVHEFGSFPLAHLQTDLYEFSLINQLLC